MTGQSVVSSETLVRATRTTRKVTPRGLPNRNKRRRRPGRPRKKPSPVRRHAGS